MLQKSHYLRFMIRIVLLGSGNIATHLCKAFISSDAVSIIQVYSRNKESLLSVSNLVDTTTSLSDIKEADVYIIAIPDDAIHSFSETLPCTDKLVVHTSGSVGMDSLSEKNRKGVFYPLQTFSKNREVNYTTVPICVEAEKASDLNLLKRMGQAISENINEINSEERAKIHLAAVFVNNFVNQLYYIGSGLLEENSLSFDLLKPLIVETANKIKTLTPTEAETGPAKRND